jgi:hypothetical protein
MVVNIVLRGRRERGGEKRRARREISREEE